MNQLLTEAAATHDDDFSEHLGMDRVKTWKGKHTNEFVHHYHVRPGDQDEHSNAKLHGIMHFHGYTKKTSPTGELHFSGETNHPIGKVTHEFKAHLDKKGGVKAIHHFEKYHFHKGIDEMKTTNGKPLRSIVPKSFSPTAYMTVSPHEKGDNEKFFKAGVGKGLAYPDRNGNEEDFATKKSPTAKQPKPNAGKSMPLEKIKKEHDDLQEDALDENRYHVVVSPYSLGSGEVGKDLGNAKVLSKHKSIHAAGRALGSHISGKNSKEPQRHAGTGNGYRLMVHDTHTGEKYTRNQIRDLKESDDHKVGDRVHLGFGAKGGTGFFGKLTRLDDHEAEIKHENGKTYKGPRRFLSKESYEPDYELDEATDYGKGKMFLHLDDSPDSHKQRMNHSLTAYDRNQESRAAKSKKGYHNPYALGHYLGAADRAHEAMKNGMSAKDAINKHFNGPLAKRLHKHLGTDSVNEDVEQVDEKNWIAGAIKHPGAEKRAAKKAGESTHDYMEDHKDDPGKAGKRARLGLTLSRLRKEDIDVTEGRLAMPLKGHHYHTKSDDELHYIRKDAGEAARLQAGMSSENKYRDQVNDAETVLHYRSKGGKRVVKEDVIDELDRKTLKSYYKKASRSQEKAGEKMDREEDKAMSTDGNKYPEKQARHQNNANLAHKVWLKRHNGLKAADKRLKD